MAVTTLEAAAAIQKPEYTKTTTRCALPLKVLGITNGVFLAAIVAAVSMPELVQDLLDTVGLPAQSALRTLDIREPAYMAFALVWFIAVVYMHVDEINETRLALRSAPESEAIRAFTVEDLLGHFVRAAVLLIPAFGLYFMPLYLHKATVIEHVTFVAAFALQFLLWRCVRKE